MSERSVSTHPGIEPGWMLERRWELDGATVRAIEETDLDHLRRWRNEQQEVLRQQAPLSGEHQLNWFRSIVEPSYVSEQFPAALLVVVEEDGEPTSYGGLTNIEWVSRRGEVSFLAASERAHGCRAGMPRRSRDSSPGCSTSRSKRSRSIGCSRKHGTSATTTSNSWSKQACPMKVGSASMWRRTGCSTTR